MSPGHRRLVDPRARRHARAPASAAPRHRSGLDLPGFIPTDPQDPRGALDVSLPQDVDRQPLEQRREPRPRLGPRQPHLPDAVGRAVHPRRPRAQVRLELATVQMPPRPLLGVVVQRQVRRTLRTRPAPAVRVPRPHLDPLLLHLQLDAGHRPRRVQPQQLPVEFDVLHGVSRSLPRACRAAMLGPSGTHSKPGSAVISRHRGVQGGIFRISFLQGTYRV